MCLSVYFLHSPLTLPNLCFARHKKAFCHRPLSVSDWKIMTLQGQIRYNKCFVVHIRIRSPQGCLKQNQKNTGWKSTTRISQLQRFSYCRSSPICLNQLMVNQKKNTIKVCVHCWIHWPWKSLWHCTQTCYQHWEKWKWRIQSVCAYYELHLHKCNCIMINPFTTVYTHQLRGVWQGDTISHPRFATEVFKKQLD